MNVAIIKISECHLVLKERELFKDIIGKTNILERLEYQLQQCLQLDT